MFVYTMCLCVMCLALSDPFFFLSLTIQLFHYFRERVRVRRLFLFMRFLEDFALF
jgi:hypothetical protein